MGRCPSVCLPKADCHGCTEGTPVTGAPEHHQLSSFLWVERLLVESLLQSDNSCFSFILSERSLAQEWENGVPLPNAEQWKKRSSRALTIPGHS